MGIGSGEGHKGEAGGRGRWVGKEGGAGGRGSVEGQERGAGRQVRDSRKKESLRCLH